MKWVAVKDGGPILCGVRAIPRISLFRLVLGHFGPVLDPKIPKIKNVELNQVGMVPRKGKRLTSTPGRAS